MRKICIGAILACFLVSIGAAAYSSVRERTFTGVIIYLSDTSFEVKRGRRELVLVTTPETVYRNADGSVADRSVLELCSTVRVQYAERQGSLQVVQVQLVREGYCFRQ
jgi:hypothetical protein